MIDVRDDGKVPSQLDGHTIREEVTLGSSPWGGSEDEGDKRGTLAQ